MVSVGADAHRLLMHLYATRLRSVQGQQSTDHANALAEALNGTFEVELIEHQGPWRDFDEVERAVFQWVAWYHGERLHSALGYVPPDEYEQAYWTRLEQVPQTA